jgi:hypothetical protein
MKFLQWYNSSLDCSGSKTSTSCTINIPSDYNEANFLVGPQVRYKNQTLHVKVKGSGSGTVTSSPSGISCSSGTCSKSFSTGGTKKVTYTASASSGSVFAGWGTESEGTTNPWCLDYEGAGKGGTKTGKRLTSSTCYDYANGYKTNGYTTVAYFNKKSSSSSSSGGDSSSESTSSSPSDSTSTTEKDGSPKSPTVDKIKVGDSEVSTKDPIEINSDEPLVLSGKTVPNGLITLTIHSDPYTVTTKADKNGNWSYTITDLPAGDHYVEASVKDPKTKKTSKIGKLLSFTVASADSPASTVATATEDVAASGSKNWLIALPVVAVVLAVGSWFGWKWWQKHKAGVTSPPSV